MSLIVKVLIFAFVGFKIKRLYDQEANRLSLLKSQNVITKPSDLRLSSEELQLAVVFRTGDGVTYKGKHFSHYIKAVFEIESQMLVNGEFETEYETFEPELCTNDHFSLS